MSLAASVAAGPSALVMELTICMQQYIKSVFVFTLVYKVKKRALFMGKSHENLHGGLMQS